MLNRTGEIIKTEGRPTAAPYQMAEPVKAAIAATDNFERKIEIRPIAVLKHTFPLGVAARLLTAKNQRTWGPNLTLTANHHELWKFKEQIERKP